MKKLLTGFSMLLLLSQLLWGADDWKNVIDKAAGTLVNVVVQESVDSGKIAEIVSMGSGVIFQNEERDYYLATVNTNIYGVEHKKIYAVTLDGQKFLLESVGKSESVNLAVYKFASSDAIKVAKKSKLPASLGQDVCVVGGGLNQTGGLQLSASAGIVAKTDVMLQDAQSGSQVYEVDANITQNTLGGVVLDNFGGMVGFAIDETGIGEGGFLQQGLVLSSESFFAIAQNLIAEYQKSKEKVADNALQPLPADNGFFYGLNLRNVSQADLLNYNLSAAQGVIVQSVVPESPGAEAGFVAGDLIIGAENFRVKDIETLRKIEKRAKSKGELRIIVSKNGKREYFYLKLTEPSASSLPGFEAEPAESSVSAAAASISVAPLDASQKKSLDFGVVVSDVAANSAFAKAGLQKGDVIQEVQDVLLENQGQFEAELAKAKKGDRLLFYVVHADGSYGYVTVDL